MVIKYTSCDTVVFDYIQFSKLDRLVTETILLCETGRRFCQKQLVLRISMWPIRRGSAATRLLRSWVRIPLGGMDVFLLWVLSGRERFLRRADHSSRGVLPTVVRRCVWSRNLVKEKVMVHWVVVVGGGWLLRKKKGKKIRIWVWDF